MLLFDFMSWLEKTIIVFQLACRETVNGGTSAVYRLEKLIGPVHFHICFNSNRKREGYIVQPAESKVTGGRGTGGASGSRAERTEAIRELAVLLANHGRALWLGELSGDLLGREIVLQLDVRLLGHLPHQRVHLVLRRRHGRRGAHRVLHVGRLDVEVRELRLEFVHHE